MRFKKIILILIVAFSISSCCTDMSCDQEIFPRIVVNYTGMGSNDLKAKMIIVIDKGTHDKIDSISFSNTDHYFVIDKWLMYNIFGDYREFYKYDFLLKLQNRQDQVTNIKYDRTSDKIDCNSCFPFGDGSATITDFENLEFRVNNVSYSKKDTVVIDSK